MAIMVPVEIGERIGLNVARLMKQQALTQGQVAAKAGLSQPVISDLARGKTKDPPITTLLKVSGAFAVDVTVLLADITPQDVAETESQFVALEEFRALKVDVANLNKRLALVLDRLPPAEGDQRQHGTQ